MMVQISLLATVKAVPRASNVEIVEGNIVNWIYREKIKYSRSHQEGMVEYEVPSHYIVIISNFKNADKDNMLALDLASNIACGISFTDRVITDLDKDHRCLFIKAEKINPLLLVGAHIKITDYKISEFSESVETSYKNLLITPAEEDK